MFWSEPFCPCDPAAKKWIEKHLEWLSHQFPSNIFTDRPLILPTNEFFPQKYEPPGEAARETLKPSLSLHRGDGNPIGLSEEKGASSRRTGRLPYLMIWSPTV